MPRRPRDKDTFGIEFDLIGDFDRPLAHNFQIAIGALK